MDFHRMRNARARQTFLLQESRLRDIFEKVSRRSRYFSLFDCTGESNDHKTTGGFLAFLK